MTTPAKQKRCRIDCDADGHGEFGVLDSGGSGRDSATCKDCGSRVEFGVYDYSCNYQETFPSEDVDECECPKCSPEGK